MAKSKKKITNKQKPQIKKTYPEYIQNFINKVESETPFKVHIDQYNGDCQYHVGVIKKTQRTNHCIWMVGYVDKPEYLNQFWSSAAYKSHTKD